VPPTTTVFAPPLNEALVTEAANAPPPSIPSTSAVLMSVAPTRPQRALRLTCVGVAKFSSFVGRQARSGTGPLGND
jgi:hypothetical protein